MKVELNSPAFAVPLVVVSSDLIRGEELSWPDNVKARKRV